MYTVVGGEPVVGDVIVAVAVAIAETVAVDAVVDAVVVVVVSVEVVAAVVAIVESGDDLIEVFDPRVVLAVVRVLDALVVLENDVVEV